MGIMSLVPVKVVIAQQGLIVLPKHGDSVEDPHLIYDPWAVNDTFNFNRSNGYTNAISHIEFCATATPPPVPELPTIALTSIGLLGVLFLYRRFK